MGIEHVPTIVDMRRNLVNEGDLDPLLQQTLENYGKQGNSYGKSARMRARWAKGLDFKIPDARKEPVEYVWFVGDFASFDERVAGRLADRGSDPPRRRGVVRAALRGRAQFRQRRAAGRRGGSVRDARRAEHGCTRRSPVRGDLHHRSALAQCPAQRVSAVRPGQAGLPLHRAARRPRRARRDLPAHAAVGNSRHVPRPVLSRALQPHHRGAAPAHRGHRRRAGGDAAPRHEHLLLRRRRRPDLDDGRGRRRRRAAERAAHPRGADARRARLLPRQLPQGPGHVLRRREGRRRRLRGGGADGADRARPRAGRTRGQPSPR